MDSLLVISEEPALSETLEHELPGIRIEQVRFNKAATRLNEDETRLIILDEGADKNIIPLQAANASVIRLKRPVVLTQLLYTIRERLQGKSAENREELALGQSFRLCPSERMLRSENGTVEMALTEKETALLQSIIKAGQPISREDLLKQVWGYNDDIATHTLETHIYRLRNKLHQLSEGMDIVFSEENGGAGYYLQLTVEG